MPMGTGCHPGAPWPTTSAPLPGSPHTPPPGAGSQGAGRLPVFSWQRCTPPCLSPAHAWTPYSLPAPVLPHTQSIMINDFIPKSGWDQVTYACPKPTWGPPPSGADRSTVWVEEGAAQPFPRRARQAHRAPRCHCIPSRCPGHLRAWRPEGLRLGDTGAGSQGPEPHTTGFLQGGPPTHTAPCASGIPWRQQEAASPANAQNCIPVPILAGRERKGPPALPAGVTA